MIISKHASVDKFLQVPIFPIGRRAGDYLCVPTRRKTHEESALELGGDTLPTENAVPVDRLLHLGSGTHRRVEEAVRATRRTVGISKTVMVSQLSLLQLTTSPQIPREMTAAGEGGD